MVRKHTQRGERRQNHKRNDFFPKKLSKPEKKLVIETSTIFPRIIVFLKKSIFFLKHWEHRFSGWKQMHLNAFSVVTELSNEKPPENEEMTSEWIYALLGMVAGVRSPADVVEASRHAPPPAPRFASSFWSWTIAWKNWGRADRDELFRLAARRVSKQILFVRNSRQKAKDSELNITRLVPRILYNQKVIR